MESRLKNMFVVDERVTWTEEQDQGRGRMAATGHACRCVPEGGFDAGPRLDREGSGDARRGLTVRGWRAQRPEVPVGPKNY